VTAVSAGASAALAAIGLGVSTGMAVNNDGDAQAFVKISHVFGAGASASIVQVEHQAGSLEDFTATNLRSTDHGTTEVTSVTTSVATPIVTGSATFNIDSKANYTLNGGGVGIGPGMGWLNQLATKTFATPVFNLPQAITAGSQAIARSRDCAGCPAQ
jgi:hypothetical protein